MGQEIRARIRDALCELERARIDTLEDGSGQHELEGRAHGEALTCAALDSPAAGRIQHREPEATAAAGLELGQPLRQGAAVVRPYPQGGGREACGDALQRAAAGD